MKSSGNAEQKLICLGEMIALNNSKLWIKFIRQEKKDDYGCSLDVEWIGLAANLTIRCKNNKNHSQQILADRVPGSHPQHCKSYNINLLSILAAHKLGLGYVNMTELFSFLNMKYMCQSAFQNTEKHVGELVVAVRNKAIDDAMKEEQELTPDTFHTDEHGTLPACTFAVDEGWNKKGSGRLYNSATGTMNAIGVRSKKVCWSETLCNRCTFCERLKRVTKKKEKAIAAQNKKKIIKYTNIEEKPNLHKCLKT